MKIQIEKDAEKIVENKAMAEKDVEITTSKKEFTFSSVLNIILNCIMKLFFVCFISFLITGLAFYYLFLYSIIIDLTMRGIVAIKYNYHEYVVKADVETEDQMNNCQELFRKYPTMTYLENITPMKILQEFCNLFFFSISYFIAFCFYVLIGFLKCKFLYMICQRFKIDPFKEYLTLSTNVITCVLGYCCTLYFTPLYYFPLYLGLVTALISCTAHFAIFAIFVQKFPIYKKSFENVLRKNFGNMVVR